MNAFDVVIVGGGVVGLTLAALLQPSRLRVAVVEQSGPLSPPPDPAAPATAAASLRVSAINLASEALFRNLGIWPAFPHPRCEPYQRITVWQHIGAGTLDFTAHAFDLSHFGHVVEDQWLRTLLWQRLRQETRITLLAPVRLQQIVWHETSALLTLEAGHSLSARLVVAADGANSWVRQQADIPLLFCDYPHHAMVATIRTTLPHRGRMVQIFHPDSILALLPLADPHRCSIVWSLPPLAAAALQRTEMAKFNHQLSAACDRHLGDCQLISERDLFPLAARYAQSFAAERVALIGDAAHTLHPLAGQGINLGLGDAASLASCLQRLQAAGQDIGRYRHLRAFERQRKYEASKLLAVTSGLQRLFAGDHPLKRALRGLGLQLTDCLTPLKAYLVRQASGG